MAPENLLQWTFFPRKWSEGTHRFTVIENEAQNEPLLIA
jgi:hypothetical protein